MNPRPRTTRLTMLSAAALLALAGIASRAVAIDGIAYQGQITVAGQPFDGSAQFRFAILSGATASVWSNDNTSVNGSMPTAAVTLPVAGGVFNASLGAAPMTLLTAANLAGATNPRLRIWVDTGTGPVQLADQPIPSSAYALASRQIGAQTTGRAPRWNGLALVGGSIADTGARVGIGTASPTSPLTVAGEVAITGAGNGLVFPDATQLTTRTVQGAQGPAGPQGAAGPQGIVGTAGITGVTGPQGPAGTTGPTGSSAPFTIDGSGNAIFTAGNMGVGTAAAPSTVTVVAPAGEDQPLSLLSTSTSSTILQLQNTTTGLAGLWGVLANGVDAGAAASTLSINSLGGPRLTFNLAGDVGVGTTTPEAPLHVSKGSAGAVTANGNAGMVAENSTSAWVNLLAPDASESGVVFGEPTIGSIAGGFLFNNSFIPDGLSFFTHSGASNIIRLNVGSDGRVGIANSAPEAPLQVSLGSNIINDTSSPGFVLIGPDFDNPRMILDPNQFQVIGNLNFYAALFLNASGGAVGIGTLFPEDDMLEVSGQIETLPGPLADTGGLKFPDGTRNNTARFSSSVVGPVGPASTVQGPVGFSGPAGALGPAGPAGPRGTIGPPNSVALCGVVISCGIGWSAVTSTPTVTNGGNHPCTATSQSGPCSTTVVGQHCIVCVKNP